MGEREREREGEGEGEREREGRTRTRSGEYNFSISRRAAFPRRRASVRFSMTYLRARCAHRSPPRWESNARAHCVACLICSRRWCHDGSAHCKAKPSRAARLAPGVCVRADCAQPRAESKRFCSETFGRSHCFASDAPGAVHGMGLVGVCARTAGRGKVGDDCAHEERTAGTAVGRSRARARARLCVGVLGAVRTPSCSARPLAKPVRFACAAPGSRRA